MLELSQQSGVDPYHRQLDLVAEMGQEFVNSRDLGEALRRGLQRVAAFIEAEAASLFLIDQKTGDLVCHASVGPVDITGLRLAAGQGVVGRVVEQNKAAIIKDVGSDPHVAGLINARAGLFTRSILCAPLTVQDQKLGAIELINKAGHGVFHPGDRQLLQALGASAALAIRNAQLTKAMVDQERVRRELELAAEIQRGMLPGEPPEGFPVRGINRPAYEVSGDFFEILELPGERVAFAIGDVSGKGFNASLLMVRTASLFRCLAKTHRRPGPLLAAMNAELCETNRRGGMFVTMVAGVLHRPTGSVLLANAGHEPAVLCRDGSFHSYAADAPPLGIAPDLVSATMREQWLQLAGGALYLFTDGLTETPHGAAMLGADGVRRLISEAAALPAGPRLAAIIERLAPPGSSPRDDLTLMVVEDHRPKPLLAERFEICAECLCEMRHRVAVAALAAGFNAQATADVVLAIDEACQNIIRHGYHGRGEVVLELRADDQRRLEVQLIDFAAPVDPAKVRSRPFDDLRPGGLGCHFMRAVMDDVAFLPPPDGAGNLLRMVKALR